MASEIIKWQRKRAIKACFEKGTIDIDLRAKRFYIWAFYWLKTLICLLLNRLDGDTYLRDSIYVLSYDVTCTYFGEYSWRGVFVETGVFRNWKACLTDDGT